MDLSGDYEQQLNAKDREIAEKNSRLQSMAKSIRDLQTKLCWMCESYKTPALMPADIKDWWNDYRKYQELEKTLEKRNKQKAALAKLTVEERELLGIKENTIPRV